MNTYFKRWPALVITALLSIMLALPAFAAQPTPPFPIKIVKEDRGKEVTILAGFDINEFGGNDAKCTRTELDAVALHEEVGSADEPCKIIVEWSLKDKDATITSGFYAVEPGEWFRFDQPYEAANGPVRFVGTIWYLPVGWNSHMLAANMGADWKVKNPDLIAYVGLSPTDDWVEGLWKAAEGGATISDDSAAPSGGSGNSCTVTSAKYKLVNVRSEPSTNGKIVRTEKVGNLITFVSESGGWKKLGDNQFMLGTLCVASEQADG